MPPAEEPTKTTPVRVLVVDDHRDAGNSLALLLRLWGFEVRTSYGAQEGLEAMRAQPPDIVISDISMPGMSGYQLAEEIRRDNSLQRVSLIALSANLDAERARAAGFDLSLVKPVDAMILAKILGDLQTMDKQLQRAEKTMQTQGEVVQEARDLMREVRSDVQEIKQEIKEVKEDVKEMKDELRELKDGDEAP